jgi:hypothetical protein
VATHITASSNAYTVTFDGTAVTVASRRNPARVLRRIPADELVGVNLAPAGRILRGQLILRALSRPTPYDVVAFRAHQQLMFTALARSILEHIAEATSRDAGSALAAMRHHARARHPSQSDRALTRAFGGRTTPVLPAVVGGLCVLFVCTIVVWLLAR